MGKGMKGRKIGGRRKRELPLPAHRMDGVVECGGESGFMLRPKGVFGGKETADPKASAQSVHILSALRAPPREGKQQQQRVCVCVCVCCVWEQRHGFAQGGPHLALLCLKTAESYILPAQTNMEGS